MSTHVPGEFKQSVMSDLTLRLYYEDLPLARRHSNTTLEVFAAGGANHFRDWIVNSCCRGWPHCRASITHKSLTVSVSR